MMFTRTGTALILALVPAPAAGALQKGAMVIAPAALAKDTTSPTATTRTPWPAPVGHRQPRPQDIPAEMPAKSGYDLQLDRLQRVMDGRLTICRGC